MSGPRDHDGHYTERPGDRTVGVLGGMGPHATVDFFRRLVERTPADKDWDHLHIIVDDNPRMPSRTRAFLYGEPSPAPYLAAGARRLAAMGARVIAVPCNSASYFLADARAQVDAEILDPVGATAAALIADGRSGRPLVLGGVVTARADLYGAALAGSAVAPRLPGADDQAEVLALIERLKRLDLGAAVVARLAAVIARGRADGADAVVLGCTELGLVAARLDGALPVFDSNAILADATLARARA